MAIFKSVEVKHGKEIEKPAKEKSRLRKMLNVNDGALISALLGFRLLRNTGIQARLLASFLVLSFVPLLVSGIISYEKSNEAIKSKISASSIQVMKQLGLNLQSELDRITALVNELCFEDTVQKDMQDYQTADDIGRYTISTDISGLLVNKFISMGYIRHEGIIFDNGDTIFNGIRIDLDNDFYRELLKEAEESKGTPVWKIVRDGTSNKLLAYARTIKFKSGAGDLGKVIILVDPKQFSDRFEDVDMGEGSNIFVLDSKGMVVSAAGKDISFGSAYGDTGLTGKLAAADKETTGYFTNAGNMTVFSRMKDVDWTIVCTVPTAYLTGESDNIRNAIILICIICFVLALILSYAISKSISVPLGRLMLHMKRAKEGDLSFNAAEERKDEIGEVAANFNDMVGNIRKLLSRVQDSARNVLDNSEKISNSSQRSYSSAEQVATSVQEIAKGASQQAQDAAESVGSMNLLMEGINRVAEGIDRVSGVVSNTKQLSENALATVKSLDAKARQTTEVSERIINDISSLNSDMKQIRSIVRVIVEIAEQTNLLSLNASIEAARAGEAGMGFAVVAEEVKKLAHRSREASITINGIIEKVRQKTEETANAANSASSIIREQMGAVDDTNRAFKTIYEAMEGISGDIGDVAASLMDSETTRSKTLSSIENMSAVTEQSAASVQEVNASTQEQIAGSEELANLAKDMNEMAAVLEKEIGLFRF